MSAVSLRAAGLLFTACVSLPVLAADLVLPDLSGTWRLNKQQSDDPAQRMKEAPLSGGSRGGPPRGGSRNDDRRAQDPDFFAAMDVLVIVHRDPMLSITDAHRHERVVFTDGRKIEEKTSRGGTTKVVAEWKDGHVEITSKPESGPKIVEAFTVSADRSQLRVTTRLEGERGPITIRRVYDAAPPHPPGTSTETDLPPEL